LAGVTTGGRTLAQGSPFELLLQRPSTNRGPLAEGTSGAG